MCLSAESAWSEPCQLRLLRGCWAERSLVRDRQKITPPLPRATDGQVNTRNRMSSPERWWWCSGSVNNEILQSLLHCADCVLLKRLFRYSHWLLLNEYSLIGSLTPQAACTGTNSRWYSTASVQLSQTNLNSRTASPMVNLDSDNHGVLTATVAARTKKSNNAAQRRPASRQRCMAHVPSTATSHTRLIPCIINDRQASCQLVSRRHSRRSKVSD